MPINRVTDRLSDDQTDARRNRRRGLHGRLFGQLRPSVSYDSVVQDDVRLHCPSAMLDRCTEVGRSSHPVLSREHRRAACAQAVSERRPLLRRAVTMARPARVRIRSRKPCTRARRRLLGWKVRLPLATAHSPYCILRHVSPTHRKSVVPVARDALGKLGELLRLARNRRGLRPLGRSQPYRQRSGDCSRVLMHVRRVKPRCRYRTAPCPPASEIDPAFTLVTPVSIALGTFVFIRFISVK